jgi:hypothetical protein
MIDSIIDEHFGGYSVVRVDYLEITGDACAAQILHSLEYWTAHRFREIERIEQQNAEAIKNGGQITPVPSEWLYEKIQTFVEAICGTFKRNKVIEALKLLKNKGFIESKPSSIPRDQTLLYRFNIEKVEQSLREAKASKGFGSKRKTKFQSLDINDESLNSNSSQSLDLNRQSLDLNSVQSSDLNSDLYIIHDLNIQVLNSKDPLTPKGGTGCLSQEGDGENLTGGGEERSPNPVEPPQAIQQGAPVKTKSLSEDQTSAAPTPIYSVSKKEHQDRIVEIYQANKPSAWLPVNNLHRAIRVQVDNLLSSDDFSGDLEAFLTRLENALLELNDPTTRFGWFRNQGNLGITTLLSNYGKHLMEFSNAWVERQNPQTRSAALPDWALEAQKEIEARQTKKAG